MIRHDPALVSEHSKFSGCQRCWRSARQLGYHARITFQPAMTAEDLRWGAGLLAALAGTQLLPVPVQHLQSEVLHLKERIALLEAPKPDSGDPAPAEVPARPAQSTNGQDLASYEWASRPWWRRLLDW